MEQCSHTGPARSSYYKKKYPGVWKCSRAEGHAGFCVCEMSDGKMIPIVRQVGTPAWPEKAATDKRKQRTPPNKKFKVSKAAADRVLAALKAEHIKMVNAVFVEADRLKASLEEVKKLAKEITDLARQMGKDSDIPAAVSLAKYQFNQE